jgi:uncharacterized protein (DUF427 family)
MAGQGRRRAFGVNHCGIIAGRRALSQQRPHRLPARSGELARRRIMAKAMWNGAVIAESDSTVMVEGNHYFPRSSVNNEFLEDSGHSSVCYWKGEASYYSVVVAGQKNQDAAWFYADPMSAAANIKDHVAFWRGVRVEA